VAGWGPTETAIAIALLVAGSVLPFTLGYFLGRAVGMRSAFEQVRQERGQACARKDA
jgi:membrane protein DedA with SNARE-associated domain